MKPRKPTESIKGCHANRTPWYAAGSMACWKKEESGRRGAAVGVAVGSGRALASGLLHARDRLSGLLTSTMATQSATESDWMGRSSTGAAAAMVVVAERWRWSGGGAVVEAAEAPAAACAAACSGATGRWRGLASRVGSWGRRECETKGRSSSGSAIQRPGDALLLLAAIRPARTQLGEESGSSQSCCCGGPAGRCRCCRTWFLRQCSAPRLGTVSHESRSIHPAASHGVCASPGGAGLRVCAPAAAPGPPVLPAHHPDVHIRPQSRAGAQVRADG